MDGNSLTAGTRVAKDTIAYTCCGYHCFNRCVLRVRIRNGVIVACEPDDTINPNVPREDTYLPVQIINSGMIQSRPCVKGYTQTRMIYDPRRLKYPMKRAGKRGEANFERISWEEALDIIAKQLMEIKRNYGPYSILHQPYSAFTVSSFPIAPWFGAGFAGWGSLSFGGLYESERWVLGKEALRGELLQDEVNIFESKLIVLWGLNPLTTLNGKFAYNLLRAKEMGIPIVCIESRYSPSVEVLADQWIPIRPTTDVAMMIAMANVWFKENLCDDAFVARNVESEGLQRWKDYVFGLEDGVEKTPQWAENICGVPAETIEGFARLYASSKPVNLHVAGAIGRQFYGENPSRAVMYLQALTGNVCVPGGTCGVETFVGSWVRDPNLPPKVDWQQKPGKYNPPILGCHFKWLKAINLRKELDEGRLTKDEYNEVIGNTPGNEPPNVRMVILESTNQVNNLPDINSNIRAMKELDFSVVFSYFAETLSARYADVLLPQVATAFEGRSCQCGLMNQDLFFQDSNHFIYRQKCIDPPGEIKTNEWIWVQIARRLGIAESAFPRLANVPDEKWDEVIEGLHREAYENWSKRKDIVPLHPPSWEEFQKKPVFRWKIKDPHYPFKKKGFDPAHHLAGSKDTKNPELKIDTESGKIEFYSKKLARGPDYLANNEFTPGCGNCYGGGNLPPMAQMTLGGKDTFYSKDTEKYPLLMSTPHSMYRVHSLLDNQPLLSDDCYRHAVWINIIDAKARKIADDDEVRVFNDVGEIIMPAYVTSRVVPGTVCIFHGGWYIPGEFKTRLMPEGIDTRGSSNLLTHNKDLPDTIIGFLPCKGLVQIEKRKEKQ